MRRKDKVEAREKRKKRMRKKIQGTATKPRLCVYKSLAHTYAQLVDDSANKVVTGVSTLHDGIKGTLKNGGNIEAAKKIGDAIAKKAIELGIGQVVFDRNGFKYHGRIRALAEGAREAGLKF